MFELQKNPSSTVLYNGIKSFVKLILIVERIYAANFIRLRIENSNSQDFDF